RDRAHRMGAVLPGANRVIAFRHAIRRLDDVAERGTEAAHHGNQPCEDEHEPQQRNKLPQGTQRAADGRARQQPRDHRVGAGEHQQHADQEQQADPPLEARAPIAPGARPEPRRPRLVVGPPWRLPTPSRVPSRIAAHDSANLYPMPYTVRMYRGRRESGSIFLRMFLTWVSMARSKASTSVPRTASSSCARVRMRPGCRASAANSWNSVVVRSIGAPLRDTCMRVPSMTRSPRRRTSPPAPAASARRSTDRTRATSSRGLNGLVM